MIAVNTNGGAQRSSVMVGSKPVVALKLGKYASKRRTTTWLVIAIAIHHTFQSLMTSHSPAPWPFTSVVPNASVFLHGLRR